MERTHLILDLLKSQPASLQYERTMFISYLDDEIMVARDETGAPDIMYRIPMQEAQKLTGGGPMGTNDPFEDAAQAIEDAVEDTGNAVIGMMERASEDFNAAMSSAEAAAKSMEDSVKSMEETAKSVVEGTSEDSLLDSKGKEDSEEDTSTSPTKQTPKKK